MKSIGLNIAGDLPAKEVVPLEIIYLLEFGFLQQAVTQSWVYGHVTVARERNDQNTHHLVNWANNIGDLVGGRWQVASPAQDTHMWRKSAISNESTLILCHGGKSPPENFEKVWLVLVKRVRRTSVKGLEQIWHVLTLPQRPILERSGQGTQLVEKSTLWFKVKFFFPQWDWKKKNKNQNPTKKKKKKKKGMAQISPLSLRNVSGRRSSTLVSLMCFWCSAWRCTSQQAPCVS